MIACDAWASFYTANCYYNPEIISLNMAEQQEKQSEDKSDKEIQEQNQEIPAQEEERAPEFSDQKYYDVDGVQMRFSFPPGSAVSAFERNVNKERRKVPKEGVSPRLTSPVAPPSEYYQDPSYGTEIVLADQLTSEECPRRIQVGGHGRCTPYINLPLSWVYSMLPEGWRDKKKALDVVHLYFTADRKMIIITARPPDKTIMERNLKINPVDSDEYAQIHEEIHE
jgi:hypothetical protein